MGLMRLFQHRQSSPGQTNRKNGYLQDSMANQFLIDPLLAGLIGYAASEIYTGAYETNIDSVTYGFLLGFSRVLSSTFYNYIAKNQEENNVSRFFRDYILPPALAAATGGVYGYIVDEKLALPSAIIVFFSELFGDVIKYRLEKRF